MDKSLLEIYTMRFAFCSTLDTKVFRNMANPSVCIQISICHPEQL